MAQLKADIVIVGGGTAGWLAAMILQAESKRAGRPLSITLIESSKIPTIGVGEGTTSLFRGVLQRLGLDEQEFIAKTEATIKYGIRHRDWRRKGHLYDGPIDDVYHLADKVEGRGSWIDTFCVAAGRSVAEPHLFGALMKQNRAPVAPTPDGLRSLSQFHHAYHFDQAKVGAWLRSKADGITHIDAAVEGARLNSDNGRIVSLVLDTGERVSGSFFIDATGFRRSLICNEMGSKWKSYSDVLPVNRAMPFWIDLAEGEEIPTYTHAWAQSSGWMWQIPTQHRIGCGYVYSDAHLTPEQAQAEIEKTLGHAIEPRNDIKIDSGRVEQPLNKNVLAIGLAASFLEPLEATSIHGTLVSILLFVGRHLKNFEQISEEQEASFNRAISGQTDDFRDFINLHYVSERRDSTFWCDVAENYIQPQTKARLELWQHKMPGPEDFTNELDGLPHLEELLHLPVLDGLGLLNQSLARKVMNQDKHFQRFARETADFLTRQSNQMASKAVGHRAWLDDIRSSNLSSAGVLPSVSTSV
jgi:tryptophan halogenase